MRHLTDAEFVDLLDGVLAEPRVAHVGRCEACGARADALRFSLAQAMSDETREPSPLFWDHFPARVSEAIRHEPGVEPITRANWLRNPGSRWAAAASVVILLMVAAAWRATLVAPMPAGLGGGTAPQADATAENADRMAGLRAGTAADDVEADESWAVVRTAAEGLEWDDVQQAGISARPGSAEGVALELSEGERQALARLLETELKHSGA